MRRRLKRIRISTWIKLAIGLLTIATILIVFSLSSIKNWLSLNHVIIWVQNARGHTWTLILFYAVFTLAMLALPVTIFPIVGGVLFDFWVALPLNLLAATMGSVLGFALARLFGREAIEPIIKGRLRSWDRFAAHQGVKTVFLLRWIGIPPYTIANYAFGLTAVRVRDYLAGTALGLLPWMGFVTFASHSLWQAILIGGEKGLGRALVKTLWPISFLSVMVACSVASTAYIKHRKKRHSNL